MARKPSKKKGGRKVIVAASKRTGLHHAFEVESIEALAESYARKAESRFLSESVSGASLWSSLQTGTANKLQIANSSLSFSTDCYRATFGKFNPLSTEGSLAAGGRFNVGGAQAAPTTIFPNLTMGACIYAADTVQCANAEIQTGGLKPSNIRFYRLRPHRALILWSLELVLTQLSWPGLQESIDRTPLDAVWSLQKVPLASQLVASHLRLIGGDGIAYRSLRHPGGTNFCFFVRDSKEAGEIFEAEMIPELG